MSEPLDPPVRFEQKLLKYRNQRGQQQAARRLMKERDIKYTAALRIILEEIHADEQAKESSAKPAETDQAR